MHYNGLTMMTTSAVGPEFNVSIHEPACIPDQRLVDLRCSKSCSINLLSKLELVKTVAR